MYIHDDGASAYRFWPAASIAPGTDDIIDSTIS